MTAAIGLLPAAGRGTRLAAHWPKELAELGPRAGRPLIGFALGALADAGVRDAIVVVSPEKEHLLRARLGCGKEFGIAVHYATQARPLGLPDVVRAAAPTLAGRDVVLVLPDTVFAPVDVVHRLLVRAETTRADVVLGLFPTDDPTRLAPVTVDRDANVLTVYDKPASTTVRNTWGVVWWRAAFTRLCGEHAAADGGGEPTLSDVVNVAIHTGLRVKAELFDDAVYCDGGTPDGLRAARTLVRSPSNRHPDTESRML
ncbi:sugar phosphate nucleotidyltransferase [Streptomyces sp. NPDC001581]|uniref:sugar phosphate nucleotidyltransferase n=1 Tax=Streptomyces sp. NPDC001581 TaxID=3154386 RepID=UPI003326E115